MSLLPRLSQLLWALILPVLVVGGLALLAYTLAVLQGPPLPGHGVVVQVGNTSLTSSVPVALLLFAAALVTLLYLPQALIALLQLPHTLRQFFQQQNLRTTLQHVAQAWQLHQLGHPTQAQKLAQSLPLPATHPAHALITLLGLQTRALKPTQLKTLLPHPHFGPLAALQLAEAAASTAAWSDIRFLTQQLPATSPWPLPLTVLAFKAAVNLHDPAAPQLLTHLKPQLTPGQFTILSQWLANPGTPAGHPWLASFQAWLTNGNSTLPAA